MSALTIGNTIQESAAGEKPRRIHPLPETWPSRHSPGDVTKALLIVWLILSSIAFMILLAPFALPYGAIDRLVPECQSRALHGTPCPLCGMTTAFLFISKGQFSEALGANRGCLWLYLAFLVDAMAAVFVMGRLIAGRIVSCRGSTARRA